MSEHELDLRGVACPMNFVKTKLLLDKLQAGDLLSVLLDAGEPVDSVSTSIAEEGHLIEMNVKSPEGYFRLSIRKV